MDEAQVNASGEFDIDLNAVEFKPPLPDNQYELAVVKCELKLGANANQRTGKREWYFGCELRPLDPEFAEYTLYHNWSTTLAAIQIDDPAASIKSMYILMGETDPKPSVGVISTFRFIASTKLQPNKTGRMQPNIDRILGPIG